MLFVQPTDGLKGLVIKLKYLMADLRKRPREKMVLNECMQIYLVQSML